MNANQSDWSEFVRLYKSKQISVSVDKSTSPMFMRSSSAPRNWRIALKILNTLTIVALPTALVLFFFVKWWIPLIIISLVLMFRKAIKEETAKAVVEESLKTPEFYVHAVRSGVMRIITKSGT